MRGIAALSLGLAAPAYFIFPAAPRFLLGDAGVHVSIDADESGLKGSITVTNATASTMRLTVLETCDCMVVEPRDLVVTPFSKGVFLVRDTVGVPLRVADQAVVIQTDMSRPKYLFADFQRL